MKHSHHKKMAHHKMKHDHHLKEAKKHAHAGMMLAKAMHKSEKAEMHDVKKMKKHHVKRHHSY